MSDAPISPQNPLPNTFTMALGQRIRAARQARGLSQAQLAERIARRQAAVSDFEHGRMQPDATTLVMLARALDQPLAYLFPAPWGPPDELTECEHALLLAFRKLASDEHQRLIIAQVKAVADLFARKES